MSPDCKPNDGIFINNVQYGKGYEYQHRTTAAGSTFIPSFMKIPRLKWKQEHDATKEYLLRI